MQKEDINDFKDAMLTFLTVPSNLLILIWTIGLLVQNKSRFKRTARVSFLAASLVLAVILWTPLSLWIAAPLQNKFSSRGGCDTPAPTLIVHLSGAERPHLAETANDIRLNDQFARYFELQRLAQRHPSADIVFSGGYTARKSSDLDIAKAIYDTMALSQRAIFLGDAESTYGNAREVRAFLKDYEKPGPVFLVTSAMHMPRAMLSFKRQGLMVTPCPAPPISPQSATYLGWLRTPIRVENLRLFDLAVHEWAGLFYYRMTGKTDQFWPD